jgi:hypothetical protein
MALVEGGNVNEVSIGAMILSPCGVTQQFFSDRRIPLPTGFVFPIEADRNSRRTALDATKKFVVLAEKLEWYWGRYPSMLWLLYMGGQPGESALAVEEEALFKVFSNKLVRNYQGYRENKKALLCMYTKQLSLRLLQTSFRLL